MGSPKGALDEVEGFSLPAEDGDDEKDFPVPKKTTQKGGGFQCLGLSFEVLKGIKKRGYKVPTPIQRKTIPLVMSGRDVVAMARTGSGKTACFLIPLFEKLKTRSAKAGARALILSPTRELAVQTLKFIRDLGRFTGLKAVVVLGGDSMENQFSAMHGNPDIIVATPGRFLHLCVEMDLKLDLVQYVVFDEADRLFEMGFGEQMNDILARLPDSRQTLLFSATLPKLLVEFARAGLSDPVLLRLDVESKLPELLKLVFLNCRSEDKDAALLVLLKQVIGTDVQSAIFVATKHHVEYVSMLLNNSGISNTCVYSNLDPSARKINVAKFASRKVQALIVTDVAARGIDIPYLDNVINYNFPAKAKLFIHRVGRCARAGRSGTAYSLVSTEELPYLLDLHLFLGRGIKKAKHTVVIKKEKQENEKSNDDNDVEDGVFGRVPQSLLEEELANLEIILHQFSDMESQKRVCKNAYTRYIQTRTGASTESVRRLKEIDFSDLGPHPVFKKVHAPVLEADKQEILGMMRQYRPKGTVFELGGNPISPMYQAMKAKRNFHQSNIERFQLKVEERLKTQETGLSETSNCLPGSTQDEIDDAFRTVINPAKRRVYDAETLRAKKMKKYNVDKEHFIPYTAPDKYSEEGLSVNFYKEASSATLDLTGDTEEMMRNKKRQMKWDRKKKKMVQVNPDKKVSMIKTESGQWIPSTYKSGRYKEWQEKNKIQEQTNEASDGDEEENEVERNTKPLNAHPNTHWGRHNQKLERKKRDVLLKSKDQILKKRLQKEQEQKRIRMKQAKKGKKKKR
ncbi:ATP-dependent RNA helicase DDX54 [Frankliniella fusca]|uniref:RNA helicase n=1 Tax=Frankliniella fusca TaxID=407009 RepID=A0AAE1L8Q7_9NEOP|nr:ATP-dependent RNA helicase DDX54 [Frankliniella fusca]